MSNRGLPKIANIGYTHMKPNLCPLCAHCYQGGGLVRARGFSHTCHAKQTILSAATVERGRCADFEPSEDRRIPQADVNEELVLIRRWKADKEAQS